MNWILSEFDIHVFVLFHSYREEGWVATIKSVHERPTVQPIGSSPLNQGSAAQPALDVSCEFGVGKYFITPKANSALFKQSGKG